METLERYRLVRHQIARGELPRQMDDARMWGGYGTLRPCAVCGEEIRVSAVEYELDIEGNIIILCVPCYRVWRVQCGL